MLVAPLSANTLAKLANGLCDNLVVSVMNVIGLRTRGMRIASDVAKASFYLDLLCFLLKTYSHHILHASHLLRATPTNAEALTPTYIRSRDRWHQVEGIA